MSRFHKGTQNLRKSPYQLNYFITQNQNIMASPKLKVCGMRNKNNIQELISVNPDYIGFIFYSKSPRYAELILDESLLASLPINIQKVGVFVNSTNTYIHQITSQFGISFLQLHGKESPQQCEELKAKGYTIIKAFGISDEFDFSVLNPYKPVVDYFLFDTKGKDYGGNGYTFNWNILKKYDNAKPIFLSGGIGLENITDALKLDFLDVHALDVNSKFEIEPALKDIPKIQTLKEKLKEL